MSLDQTAENKGLESWPGEIDHITFRWGDEEKALNGQGLMSSRDLQGQEVAISSSVKRPATFIEFTKNGIPVRTHPSIMDAAMHPSCQLFRHKAGKERCRNCDNCHAKLFYGLKREKVTKEEIQKRRNRDKKLKDMYGKEHGCAFDLKECEKTKRPYLEYDCPLLGFRELAFPIFYENRVIAVFIIGEMTLLDGQKFVEEKIGFAVERYLGGEPAWARWQIKRRLIKRHRKYLYDPVVSNDKPRRGNNETSDSGSQGQEETRLVTQVRYEAIIEHIAEELQVFETKLKDECRHLRHMYVRNNTFDDDDIKKFREKVLTIVLERDGSAEAENENFVSEKPLRELWSAFGTTLNTLQKSFSWRYVLAFGSEHLAGFSEEALRVQAQAGDPEFFFRSEEKKDALCIPIKKVADVTSEYTIYSPEEMPCGILAFPDGGDTGMLGDFQLIFLPDHQNKENSLAILIGYEGKERGSGLHEHRKDGYFHRTLEGFFLLAALKVAELRMSGLEDLRNKQMQYLGHESDQQTGGLDWVRKIYEDTSEPEARTAESPPNRSRFYKDKLTDLCRDIRGYTGQMSFIFEMAKRFGVGDPPPEPELEPFFPYGDVLAKWKDMYRLESERKKLQIQIPYPVKPSRDAKRTEDPQRPEMWADKFLFEQVVYNLVNNAEKYCYRGTKIKMDCTLESLKKGAPHVLTITNYGPYLDPDDNKIFLPFKRSADETTKGLGLGLYVVKMIVKDVHCGNVEVLCTPVSEYNVPLIEPYIERNFDGKEKTLVPELIKEISQLKSKGIYDKVIALEPEDQKKPKYDHPSDEALRDEITKKTFEVTFRVKMPSLDE